jgi:hypothetical protein
MATTPQLSEAFVDKCEKMIAELRNELAAYEAKTAHAGRKAGREWLDITELGTGRFCLSVA